jgi:hypothetical protein
MAVSRSGVVKVVVTTFSLMTVSGLPGETGAAGDYGSLCATVARRD